MTASNPRIGKLINKIKKSGVAPKGTSMSKDEAGWQGYKEVGMKKKGNKMVPNCVPEGKAKVDELSLSMRDIRKSGIRKTTDTEKLKKELKEK